MPTAIKVCATPAPPVAARTITCTEKAAGWGIQMQVEGRPKIVCLCGSTDFMQAFDTANRDETLAGHIVLSVGVDMKNRDKAFLSSKTEAELAAIKDRLDCLHRRKIDLADEILVLNVGGKIGLSTQGEIAYAKEVRKPIRYLEPPGPAAHIEDTAPQNRPSSASS